MQTYEIGPITITLEREGSFTPVSLEFKFSVDFDSIVPETEDEAFQYHTAVDRTTKFLHGINTAYILETDYPETELFVTSRINNVSIEVPEGCNKIPLIGLMLYYKVDALLGDYDLKNFSLAFNLNDPKSDNIRTTLDYNSDTVPGSKLNAILTSCTQTWVEEMEKDITELGDSAPELIEPINAWWHRNDGHVRDFINMDIDSFESIQDEDGSNIRILTVDIDEDDDMISFMNELDSEDDETPKPPNNTDDGYFNV